jgi:hypothetical protein
MVASFAARHRCKRPARVQCGRRRRVADVLVHKMVMTPVRAGKLASVPAIDAGAQEEITSARLDRELNELLQELRSRKTGSCCSSGSCS